MSILPGIIASASAQGSSPPAATTTWNSADKNAAVVLTNGDLTATISSPSSYSNVRSTTSKTAGKFHFEGTQVIAAVAHCAIGLGNASANLSDYVGSSQHSIGYYPDGNVWHNGGNLGSAGSYSTTGGIPEVDADFDNNLVYFRPNGGASWVSFSITGIVGAKFIIWGSLTDGNQVILNCGQNPFDGSAQPGFVQWG